MRILMILTAGSADRSGQTLTLDQVIEAYYLLYDSGAEVVVASSQGGNPPIRERRKRSIQSGSSSQRSQSDRGARDAISDTLKLEEIYPEEFDGVICIGALEEPCNVAEVEAARALLGKLLAAGKPVATVPGEIHSPPRGSFDDLLISGKRICGPSLAAKAILAALKQTGG